MAAPTCAVPGHVEWGFEQRALMEGVLIQGEQNWTIFKAPPNLNHSRFL